MTYFEIAYLLSQYGLLAVTLIFYRQLTINDNAREKRVAEERLVRKIKNVLRPSLFEDGTLQRLSEDLAEKYPKQLSLILEAYDELFEEAGLEKKISTPGRFLNLLKQKNSVRWQSFSR